MLKTNRFKGIVVLLVLISATFIISTLAGCEAILSETSISDEAVQLPQLPAAHINRISTGGTVESVLSRNIYTALGLFIDEVNVEVGDRVVRGQVLAVFDTEDLELTIKQAQAQLEMARLSAQIAMEDSERLRNQASANLTNNTNQFVIAAESALRAAESNLAAIQSDYDAAVQDVAEGNSAQLLVAEAAIRNVQRELSNRERDLEDAQFMYEIGVISQIELRLAEDAVTLISSQLSDAQTNYNSIITSQERTLEQLRTSLAAATTARGQAQSALNAARNTARQELDLLNSNVAHAQLVANLEAEEIALQILERRLEDSRIESPIDGVVTQVIAREGMIGSGLMFVVEDTEDLRIITRFREYDIGVMSEGMEVRITSDAIGSGVYYMGEIARINPAASHGITGSIVEFETEVAVISEHTSLRIGMNVRVHLEI
ncbi:MAG: HlyD family secretion protein [Oscillospiraceae bacterium]|nr:HlyD family secretion protein [Oscillospiraceae bacterium]